MGSTITLPWKSGFALHFPAFCSLLEGKGKGEMKTEENDFPTKQE